MTNAPTSSPAEAPSRIQPEILVVDDHDDTRWLLREALESYGCAVTTAVDGQSAVRELSSRPLDAIVLDLSLPDIGGLEIASLVRGRRHLQDVPIVAFTARIGSEIESAALAAGCSLVLTKPAKPLEVARTVLSLIRQRHEAVVPAPSPEITQPDAATISRRIEHFRRRLPEKLAGLRTACFEAPNGETAILLAHRLAGAAGTYGFREVGRWAQVLESALRRSLRAEVASAFEHLRTQIDLEAEGVASDGNSLEAIR